MGGWITGVTFCYFNDVIMLISFRSSGAVPFVLHLSSGDDDKDQQSV